jgi:hypothetical protein
MGKKSRSGSVMNNLDHTSESIETVFWFKVLKFFDADRDPGWEKNSDPGFGINISDLQHCFFIYMYLAGAAAGHLLEGKRGGTGGDGDTLRVLAQASPSPSTGTDTHKLLHFWSLTQ